MRRIVLAFVGGLFALSPVHALEPGEIAVDNRSDATLYADCDGQRYVIDPGRTVDTKCRDGLEISLAHPESGDVLGKGKNFPFSCEPNSRMVLSVYSVSARGGMTAPRDALVAFQTRDVCYEPFDR